MTRLARNLTAEGNIAKALKILRDGIREMTDAVALQIVTGKKRLEGWNRLILRDDDAKVDSRGLPLPGSLADIIDQKDREIAREAEAVRSLSQSACNLVDGLERRALSKRYVGVTLAEGLEDVIGPKAPKPTREWQAWDCGWLSPEGDFYGCKYHGHIRLAISLGFGDGAPEREGWIKLQSFEWYPPWASLEPTQRQLDAIFEWSRVTKRPMPSWIHVVGEP